jgi:hypothetical protein
VVVVVQWLIFHGSVAIVHVGLFILEVSRSHSSQRVIGPSPIPLPDNTQHPQETDIHAPGGIRTSNPSKRAAANPRLKPRSHRDQQWLIHCSIIRLLDSIQTNTRSIFHTSESRDFQFFRSSFELIKCFHLISQTAAKHPQLNHYAKNLTAFTFYVSQ